MNADEINRETVFTANKANEAATFIADKIIGQQPIWENWYIKGKIGSGTFCNVYRIEARRTTRTDVSALKIEPILAEEKFCNNEERKKSYIEKRKLSVENETNIMCGLKDCPNIVGYQEEDMREFYLDGRFQGYYFLVRMELLENLHRLIINKKFELSEKNVLELAKQIGNGIKAAHDINIIHRDIKPENLFVSKKGVHKLGDFNISKQATFTRTIAGTPQYMAPEVMRGFDYNKQADIYSFGICLYQMMNDYLLPFEEYEEPVNQRLNGTPLIPPKNASGQFGYIILKACAFNPQERYHSIDEMLYDLENVYSIQIQPPIQIDSRTEYMGSQQNMQPQNTSSVRIPNPIPVPVPVPVPNFIPVQPPKPAHDTAKSIFIILVVLIVLATVGISGFILFGKNNNDNKSDENTTIKYSEEEENKNDYESSDVSETHEETVKETEIGNSPPVFDEFSSTSELASITNNDGTFNYNISNIADGDYYTCWAEGSSDAGINESILLSADEKQHVSEISITNGYYKDKDIFYKNNRVKNCRFEFSDGTSQEVVLLGEYSEQSNVITFSPPVDTEYIKITILSVYSGNKYNDTCISEISVN